MANEIDIEKIQESPHLLDMLLQMEDVLDSLDIYVFKNWYKGEVVEGPGVRRYWLDFTLKYKHNQMPDPKAAMRLIKHGIRVDFSKGTEKSKEYNANYDQTVHDDTVPVQKGDAPPEEKDVRPEDTVWLVAISIPRRLVAELSAEQIDNEYDDEVDIEDVDDAMDTGIDDESEVMADENGASADGAADPMADMGGAPPPQQGAPQ
jgi:hypothetical protein